MDSRPWWILLLLVRRRSTWSPPKATTRKTTSTIRRNAAVVLVLLHWAGGNAGMFRMLFTDLDLIFRFLLTRSRFFFFIFILLLERPGDGGFGWFSPSSNSLFPSIVLCCLLGFQLVSKLRARNKNKCSCDKAGFHVKCLLYART